MWRQWRSGRGRIAKRLEALGGTLSIRRDRKRSSGRRATAAADEAARVTRVAAAVGCREGLCVAPRSANRQELTQELRVLIGEEPGPHGRIVTEQAVEISDLVPDVAFLIEKHIALNHDDAVVRDQVGQLDVCRTDIVEQIVDAADEDQFE